MSVKHFNAGNVWGVVVEVKKGTNQNDKPFVSLHIDCSGSYGNVHAYGRIWGKDKSGQFIEEYKRHPGKAFRFYGFISQYLGSRENKLTNFTFYKWHLAPVQQPRAAFILKGEIVDAGQADGEGCFNLRVVRQGRGGYKDTEEIFELWTLEPEAVAALSPGRIWEVKGCLQQGGGEDEFGDASGPVKPYVLQAREIESF